MIELTILHRSTLRGVLLRFTELLLRPAKVDTTTGTAADPKIFTIANFSKISIFF